MTSTRTTRRLFLGGGLAACGFLTVLLLVRFTLAGMVVGLFLKRAGATDISLSVTRLTPWRVVVEDVAFLLQRQPFAAKRLSIDRAHWWSPSLGSVRVEQAWVPLAARQLLAQAPAKPEPRQPAAMVLPSLPLEELSVDGTIVLQAAGLTDHALTVKLLAHQAGDDKWNARLQLDGAGVGLDAAGTYDAGKQRADFSATDVALDLKAWRAFVEQVMPLPELEGWEFEGRLTGSVAGRFDDNNFTAKGAFQLRQGGLSNTAQGITAEGVEFDLDFTDLAKLRTKSGALRVHELRVKDFPLRDVAAEVSLDGTEQIGIEQLSLTTLGGTVTTEPFTYVPGGDTLKAVVAVDGISIAEVMALTKDLPATATGRVNGRFPLVLDGTGLHLGTGWLELKRGVSAEIAFKAAGLLTAGTSPKSPSYPFLQRIESGLLTLGISELRLEIHPTGAPAGRSATLHIAGAPLDPTVKAPVVLDLNVNGPLEQLLKLGMDSRLSVGGK